jgi:hypothetical protein
MGLTKPVYKGREKMNTNKRDKNQNNNKGVLINPMFVAKAPYHCHSLERENLISMIMRFLPPQV